MFSFIWTLLQRLFCCRRARRPSKGHGSKDEWSEEEGEAMLTSVTVEVTFGVHIFNLTFSHKFVLVSLDSAWSYTCKNEMYLIYTNHR
jgi:hypothetical protein